MIYSGATREHLCDRLNPGCFYRFRVYCISDGGQSAVNRYMQIFFSSLVKRDGLLDAPTCIEIYPKIQKISIMLMFSFMVSRLF